VAEFKAALESADFYTTGGTDVALADGGTGASLTAPTVDRLLMWDQGGSTIAFGVLGNIATHGSPTTGDFLLVQRQSSDDLVKVDWADLPGAAGGAPTSAQYLVVTLDGTLSAERSIAAGNGINFTDGGANSTFTIAADAASDTVDGIVELATTTEVLTGTDATRAVTPDSLAALWEKGANVASAATLSLGEGGYFHVTGTTTITDIDFATPKDGRDAILEFDGVLTLTHNATTLKLPGGASITTAAGDTCRVVQDATDNVRVAWYQRAAGGAIGAQPLDATLTALAAFNTNGLLTQTAADTFAGRTITGTANQITVTAGDGVSGNPTLSLPSDIIVPTVITTPNTGLHLLDTNASHDLIVAPGSDLTADRTLTVVTGDRNHAIDFTDPGAADTFWGWDDSADRWEALTAAEAAAIISGTSTFQPLDTTLTAFAAYNTNGLITQTAADTFTGRTITGTTNEIEVTNGNGVAGNPTIGLPDTIVITTSIELGNATDTTLARVSAGQVSIEGVTIATSSNTLTLTNKTFDANGTGNALSNVEVADFAAAAITTAADTIAGNDSDTQVPTTAAVIDFVTGRKEIYVPAAAMWPKATNGAAEITYDSGANDVTVFALGFDTTTQEYAQFGIAMPNSWNEDTVTFIPYWTNTGGASTQTVVWSLAGRALSNDDAIDGTFGTVQTSTDTWLAQNDMHVGPESAAITIGGTPAANDFVMFEISRVVGSDNMAGDAVLLGIKLVLTMATANDA
jgi:hypothetical protein